MKEIIKAIEKTIPSEIEPLALAGSGFLRALVWDSDEGCQFTICREDPDTGEMDHRFAPFEVANVVRLVGAVSRQFHEMGGSRKGCDFQILADHLLESLRASMGRSAEQNGRREAH